MSEQKPVAPVEEPKPAEQTPEKTEQAPAEAPAAEPVATETAKAKEEAAQNTTADADAEAPVAAPATEAKADEVEAAKAEAAKAPEAVAPADTTDTTAVKDSADSKDNTDAKVAEPADASADASAPATAPAAEAPETPQVPPIQQLYAAFKTQPHPEIWGVPLADPDTHVPSQIVFQKYLNANDGDVAKAKEQLLKTLAWRAETKPLDLVKHAHSKAKFEGLGYVTDYGDRDADPEKRAVFTWNVYGAAADRMSETFGDLDEFVKWRVALAELALARLSIATATKPITADHDPYKIYQVHDYLSISFLRRSAEVKASSTKTIQVFNQNYPENLREKYFVNVPVIMGFMYTFMKLFVAAKTLQKFHPMSNGATLAGELAGSQVEGLSEKLPAAYGGKGAELKGNAEQTLLQ